MAWSMESVREARLEPADVYRYYADPATWGRWGHNTKWAKGEAPVREGSVVEVMAGYNRTWPVLVRTAVADRLIECEVRPPGVLIVNRYELIPIAGGVRLRHEIEVSGRLERAYRLLRPLYVRLLAKETRSLVALIEQERARPTAGA